MEKEMFEYCKKLYNKTYRELLRKQLSETRKRFGEVKDTRLKDIENYVQLETIKNTMISGRKAYPNQVSLLWACIYKVHLYRKSGISNPEVVAKAIQAEQSWRASSGHAFEAMVKDLCNMSLHDTNIRILLQKDLNVLLRAGELANQPTDFAWLEKQVRGSVFDAYAVADIDALDEDTKKVNRKTVCFGCIQCKTSIRDRVSRDVLPSREAMDSNFWSIGFVLDGSMLDVPKYKNMANGNVNSEFKRNGWHGIYVLSSLLDNDRIYAVDLDFEIFRSHALKAFNVWHKDRMGLVPSWRADR